MCVCVYTVICVYRKMWAAYSCVHTKYDDPSIRVRLSSRCLSVSSPLRLFASAPLLPLPHRVCGIVDHFVVSFCCVLFFVIFHYYRVQFWIPVLHTKSCLFFPLSSSVALSLRCFVAALFAFIHFLFCLLVFGQVSVTHSRTPIYMIFWFPVHRNQQNAECFAAIASWQQRFVESTNSTEMPSRWSAVESPGAPAMMRETRRPCD